MAPSCKLAGDVVAAEVSRAADLAAKGRAAVPTFATRVYATGGWERTDTAADGKKTKTSGCLSGRDLAQLESDLDGLPWVQKANPMACDALAVTVTDVMIHGKVVWTEELCSAKVLDAKSTAGLADVEAILEAARKAAVPPCCKP